MKESFVWNDKIKIVFGQGVAEDIPALVVKAGYKRGILVCDRLFEQNGTAQKMLKNTPSLSAVFCGVTANPKLEDAQKAAELAKCNHADYIVALGGGSALDLAKFAASLACAEGSAIEYFRAQKTFEKQHLAVIAMPTTSGTGSEVTGVSVMSDGASGDKAPLVHDNFFVAIAVVDPLLTESVPPFVTAATGLDAMAHALEAYWCKAHNEQSDKYAVSALNRLFANIEKAYANGHDLQAREQMSRGSLEAGLAFSPTRTAAVHACSYPLSEDYHLCHGEACAFTLDSFVRYNGEAEQERMNALASALGFANYDAMADEIARIKQATGMKTTLEQVGITDVRGLAERCVVHGLMNNNPIKPSVEELEEMFGKLTKV